MMMIPATWMGVFAVMTMMVHGAPAPAAEEVVQMIHAQSLSEMKHNAAAEASAVVPMLRLGMDGLPRGHISAASNNHHLAGVSNSHFNPINLVPIPPSRQHRQDTGHRHDNGNVIAMDDSGRLKHFDLPVTAQAVVPSASSAPATVSPWMAVDPPHNGRKHVLGMEDNGLLQTLHVPLTVSNSAPAPTSMI
ncbi:hypothetical protein K492DRAFT_24843 [Lichtheimia hyalospora FSU 10163]|nr:hypothetical protein K492DRAFT_24843 [Lichtheimia hyalospora FSU 10163]